MNNKNSLKFHQIINIADDEPCSQLEVIQYCYDLLGLKMPRPILFEDAKEELSPIAQSFGWKIEEFLTSYYAKRLDID